jgi:hypothetical protein
MLVGSTDIGRDDLQDYAVLDLAALRVLELWICDILDLDLARPGVDDAAISAHDEPLLNCGQNGWQPFGYRTEVCPRIVMPIDANAGDARASPAGPVR